ncbi:MAG: WD40 repeat domain-containing protein [Anaerolineaceae bacterium]|nr:WD40 repeat domain-containing protein [Anaerolineaceae bacterium]
MGIKIIQKSLWPVIALLALVWVNRLSAQETDQIAKQIAWSPDGTMLAVGFDSNECDIQNPHSENLLILDATTLEVVTPGPVKSCHAGLVEWSPDSTRFVIVGIEGLRVWNVENQEFDLTAIGGHIIKWSPDGSMLAVGGMSGTALTVDVSTGDVLTRFPSSVFFGLAWSPNGEQLAIADSVVINVFDVNTLEEIGTIDIPGIIEQIEWEKNGSRLAVYRVSPSDMQRAIDIVDVDTMQTDLSISLVGYLQPIEGITDISLSPTGNQIAVVIPAFGVLIFDTTTGELVTHIDQEGIFAIDWSPDGSRLAYVPSEDDDELVGFLDDLGEAAR